MKSDEILAEQLVSHDFCPDGRFGPIECRLSFVVRGEQVCKECILDWARKKAREDENK